MNKIIQKYEIHGVPDRNIAGLMKELNLNERKFYEYICGQTALLVGDEVIYYSGDIERFIQGLPVID